MQSGTGQHHRSRRRRGPKLRARSRGKKHRSRKRQKSRSRKRSKKQRKVKDEAVSSQEAATEEAERLNQEREDNSKQWVSNEVLRVHGILDNLLIQPHLQNEHILELARRVMLPVRAKHLDLEGYMKRMQAK